MIIFALDKDKRKKVHVLSVERGSQCGCFCPECGRPLLAIHGEPGKEKKAGAKIEHFRHDYKFLNKLGNNNKCNYADSPESIQHFYAKAIIAEEKKVMACPLDFYDFTGHNWEIKGSELLSFSKVEVEKKVLLGGNEYRPDLFCTLENGEEMWVEIWYSNPVNGEKHHDICEQKKYPVLHIKVDGLRQIETPTDVEEYKKFLLTESSKREWLYHPLIEVAKKQREEEILQKEEEERKIAKQAEEEKNREEEERKRIKDDNWENNIDQNSTQYHYKHSSESEIKDGFQRDLWGTTGIPINTEQILNDLNDSQRKAVEYCDGPQLVIAGAGSGKTRVLTYKIAYLLQQGMRPWNLLALTFTNKAANEMKQRIAKLVGQDAASRLQMGTFHSVFSRVLRVEAELIGFNSNFTIYDEADSRSLIKSLVKEMNLDEKVYKPASVHHLISMAKNHLISAAEYAADAEVQQRDSYAKVPETGRIFLAYEQRCRQANAMDFDDLLVMTYRLLRDHREVLQKYQQRFQYILVDEYQDTNYAQQQIVLQLSREHQRVCVVGDDAQSIYAFRGANIDNILNFQNIYPDAKLFKLEQNYRSTQRIVQAANSLIKKNERQIPKDVYSRNDEGEKLVLKRAYSDKEEASIVCKDIKTIRRREKSEYSDFAILYRTNAQSRTFEEEMRRQGIPYRIYGGLSFYQRKEIKDIIAYFRLVCNPDDEEAMKRIINYPARGIGNTTVQKIGSVASEQGVSYWQVIGDARRYGLDVNRGTLLKLQAFMALMSGFITKLRTTDAYELGREIIRESGISADLFAGKDPDDISRQQNLEEFMNGLQEFVDTRREEGREGEVYLHDFLQEVSLLTDLDSDDGSESRVVLMTIHAAKGLEFPTVFIVGMEENIFPSPMSCNSLRELEEERRLLYVAITRAERHCILTCAKNRWRFGKMEFDTPSRFLRDIDPSLMTIEGSFEGGDYEHNSSYTGTHEWGGGYGGRRQGLGRMQNSRPVASQFMADEKPKITSPRRPEAAVDPFTESFKRQLAASGGNLRRVSEALRNGGRAMPSASDASRGAASSAINTSRGSATDATRPSSSPAASAQGTAPLAEGNIIEHQRFGVGTVIKVEGTGENTKATVDFRNVGTKQLLLKFARYTIIG